MPDRAFTLGDVIYVPPGRSTAGGDWLTLLVHEATHAWQVQREGSDMMPRALAAQWFRHGGYNFAPVLERGGGWRDLNPEQQATLLETAWDSGWFARPGARLLVRATDPRDDRGFLTVATDDRSEQVALLADWYFDATARLHDALETVRRPPRDSAGEMAARVAAGARRVPFTLATVAALAAIAAATSSHRRLPAAWLERVGFAPRDLEPRRLHRMVTSGLVTHGGAVLWRSLALTAFAVGTAERRHGTWRAAGTFWGVHFTTIALLGSGARAAHRLAGDGTGLARRFPRDVGPSAGYLGCLGLVASRLPPTQRRWAGAAAGAGLLAITLLPPLSPEGAEAKTAADAAHWIALPLGWLSGRWGAKSR